MAWTREADDAFSRLLGHSQESLDRVHQKADEYREAAVATGRTIRPQLSLEDAWAELAEYESDSDFDDKDLAPLSPPMTPTYQPDDVYLSSPLLRTLHPSEHNRICDSPEPWEGSSTTTSNMEMNTVDDVLHPLPTPRQSQSSVQRRKRLPTPIKISNRMTRSKSSANCASFYELATNGRTSRTCSTRSSPTREIFRIETSYSARRVRPNQRSRERKSRYRINKQ